jgi:3-oxoadipate enol-lactonase
MKNTLDRGHREFGALIGHDPDQSLAAVRAQSPQMYRWLLAGPFALVLADDRLSRRDRQIATIASLVTAGASEPQLRAHTEAALRHGVTADELRALCEHLSVYAGFPRALNALTVVGHVLDETADASPAPVRRVHLRDHDTDLVQVGDQGPPVVLIHALGLSRRMWEPVMRPLSKGRRIFAYDVRGHGTATDAPPPDDMEVLADDLCQVLDHAGLERAHVVGLSYGGGIAQTFAVRQAHRLESLTLASTTDRAFDSFEARALSIEREGMAAQVTSSLVRWFTADGLALNPWGVRYARECVLRGDPGQAAAAWRAFAKLRVEGRLERLEPRTLVLSGSRDASTTPEVMRRLAAHVRESTFRDLPGAPHMPTLESPDLFVDALDPFLPTSERLGELP